MDTLLLVEHEFVVNIAIMVLVGLIAWAAVSKLRSYDCTSMLLSLTGVVHLHARVVPNIYVRFQGSLSSA